MQQHGHHCSGGCRKGCKATAQQLCPLGTWSSALPPVLSSPPPPSSQQVKDGGKEADLVAVDFYSRYQRPTAPSCERFAATPGAPACKPNRLRWCHTDLGANAINYQRFQKERRRFGTLGVRCAAVASLWGGQESAGCCCCQSWQQPAGCDNSPACHLLHLMHCVCRWHGPSDPPTWLVCPCAAAGSVWRPGGGAL